MATPDEAAAIRAWNLLCNGMGGIDWAGFHLVATTLGVTDIEGLIDRLAVIKRHQPETDDDEDEIEEPET